MQKQGFCLELFIKQGNFFDIEMLFLKFLAK